MRINERMSSIFFFFFLFFFRLKEEAYPSFGVSSRLPDPLFVRG